MTLTEVKDWLKTKIDCPNWYTSKADTSKEQCIAVYSIQGPVPNIALGGLVNTSYSTKAISILVHWGKNNTIAEEKAQEVYNTMFGQQATIGEHRVINFELKIPEPIGVGTDENGIYEYVINAYIIYER